MVPAPLRFAPDHGGLLLSLLGSPRTTGAWERSLARQRRGRSGIVFGFRGPRSGQTGKLTKPQWTSFRIELDGAAVVRDPADSIMDEATVMHDRLRPKWLTLKPGLVNIEFHTLKGEGGLLAQIDVEVSSKNPAIVALMPEIDHLGVTEPALVWSYQLGQTDRYHASDLRRSD